MALGTEPTAEPRPTSEPSRCTHLIVTVHGIRTFGSWQDRFKDLVGVAAAVSAPDKSGSRPSTTVVRNYRYGYFSVIAFLIPMLRWLVTRRFREELKQAINELQPERIDIVAHSFGTHLAAWGLMGIPVQNRPTIHTIILAGSVLKVGFPWRLMLQDRKVYRVINECGRRDRILLLNQFFVLFTGMAGRVGFIGMEDGERFVNRFYDFGHSGYFEGPSPEAADEFMQTQWLPLLLGDDLLRKIDERKALSSVGGATTFLMNNAEPIKLAFYVAPFVALTLWVNGLKNEAVVSKTRAIESQNRAEQAATAAKAAEARAVEELREASRSDFATAQARLGEGKWQEAVAYLGRSLRYDTKNADAGASLWLTLVYGDRDGGRLPTHELAHSAAVRDVRFSPDGTCVATASDDGTAQIWDAKTGKPLGHRMTHKAPVNSIRFCPDGTRVVTASWDFTARIWDVKTGQPLGQAMQHANNVTCANFSPAGTWIVTGSLDNTARIWDAKTGHPIGTPLHHDGAVLSAIFSPDGKLVVTTSFDSTARIWNATTGQPVGPPMEHKEMVFRASFSPDGAQIVTASQDGTARVWDVKTGRAVGAPLEHSGPVDSADFSPDGSRIVTTSHPPVEKGGVARIWDAKTHQPVGDPLVHRDNVETAAFSPDGTRVITASEDHTARIWDVTTCRPLGPPLEHLAGVSCAWFSPDGTSVATAGGDNSARIWNAGSGQPLGLPLPHDAAVPCVNLAPDGQRVVTVSGNSARIWDTVSGQQIGSELMHSDYVWSATFSPDGTRVITASEDHTARIWDAAGENAGGRLLGPKDQATLHDATAVLAHEPLGHRWTHNGHVVSAVFNQDGTRVVTASEDRTAQVWDARTGWPLGPPLEHKLPVVGASFSPDGTRVVTVASSSGSRVDGAARIWDAKSGRAIGTPLRHKGLVYCASFSPDGSRVLTASNDGTARLWDAETGEPLGTPMVHGYYVVGASFSPDGGRVVTASWDTTARIWDAKTGRQIGPPLLHEHQVQYSGFSSNGAWVVTCSGDQLGNDGKVQIWNASTCQPLGPPLHHGGYIYCAKFDPVISRIVGGTVDNTAWIWEVPHRREAIDGVLCEQLTRFCGGAELDPRLGTLRQLSLGEREAIWQKIEPQLLAAPEWLAAGQTFLPSGADAPSGPASMVTVRDAATRLIRSGSDGSIQESLAIDPGNPLIQIGLAGLDELKDRAEFLRRYGLAHLPNDAAVCHEAAHMLRVQGDEQSAKQADALAEKAGGRK